MLRHSTWAVLTAATAMAADPAPIGVVSHILVTTDNVEDVSSMEAWEQSFLREGMTDRERALAVWQTVVKFRHQDAPPDEFLQGENNVHDPIKTFNVYGYGMCCCASSNIEALARYAGLEARGRIIRAHSVPEVFWDGSWHLLDASLINYFPKPDGTIAGVDEIVAGIKAWYDANPGYKGNDGKLRQFMVNAGWTRGPKVLANCPFYDKNGWLPAATHGWYCTMQEYDGSASGIYEYGYSQGYQVNVQLRPGERLTRCWINQGLHVNMGKSGVGCLDTKTGERDLRYAPAYGDIAPGRIGNGTHEYSVPLANGSFRYGAMVADNLASTSDDGQRPALHVATPGKPGTLIIRMPSSYVYLSGLLACEAVVDNGGAVEVLFSDNNGLDWRELARITETGPASIDLGPHVLRRYDYRVKLVLTGAGTGLDSLGFRHDIQNSQRALPALVQGDNTIHFRAARAEGTITIEGSTDPANRERQLVTADFHPALNGVREHLLRLEGGQGTVTFPVETPGDMVRLRLGCHFRARDERDAWEIQASFNGGETFTALDRFAGPTPGSSRYITAEDIPPGTRSALVRFAGTQRNTTCIFSYRIDADYREPHGGFRPVRVLYKWVENGQVRQHAHVAREQHETYAIRCDAKPIMRSISMELTEHGEGRRLADAGAGSARRRVPPQNTANPLAEPVLEAPTLRSLGVYWLIENDSNGNARVLLDWRRTGQDEWREGMPLFRIERGACHTEKGDQALTVPDGAWLFAGSALLLEPDTEYELRLRLVDPDGPGAERIVSARTLAEPEFPTPLRTLYVSPGAGGGGGTAADPFRGLAIAQAAAQPGDLVLLKPGVYKGTFTIDRSGEPGRPIVWRGAGNGEAVIDAGANAPERPERCISASGCHDVWFENLALRNANWGIVAHEAQRVVVRRCDIRDVDYGITCTRNAEQQPNTGFFIADNVITGPCTWPRSKGIENPRGIQLTGTGHVVCYNRITGFADAIDTFPSAECSAIDVHNNDIAVMTDDGIEMDYSFRNTRCFHNRLTNVFQGISVQPIYGGPVYIFRNVMVNVGSSPFKMHNSPSGALMLHNTSVKAGMAMVIWSNEPVRNCVFRNNLFVGTTANYAFECMAPMKDCSFDYDGFAGGPWGKFLKWNGARYDTMDDASKSSGAYRHIVNVDPTSLFATGLLPPADAKAAVDPPPDLQLNPAGNAVDAGAPLPGINDGFTGAAPDLGAIELGSPPIHYGPRPQ